MDYYRIGQRIRNYRKACNLSQEQLAEQVGISTTHLSHIETANTKLSLPVLVKIAEALSVHTDELIYEHIYFDKNLLIQEIVMILENSTNEELLLLTDILKSVKSGLNKYYT